MKMIILLLGLIGCGREMTKEDKTRIEGVVITTPKELPCEELEKRLYDDPNFRIPANDYERCDL